MQQERLEPTAGPVDRLDRPLLFRRRLRRRLEHRALLAQVVAAPAVGAVPDPDPGDPATLFQLANVLTPARRQAAECLGIGPFALMQKSDHLP